MQRISIPISKSKTIERKSQKSQNYVLKAIKRIKIDLAAK